tara:strand:+ start:13960 stop:14067 length:108 start_codon:yes stop_codon:yes gene_type:complete
MEIKTRIKKKLNFFDFRNKNLLINKDMLEGKFMFC